MTNKIYKLDMNFYLNLVNRIKDNKQFNVYKVEVLQDAQSFINSISKHTPFNSRSLNTPVYNSDKLKGGIN